MRCCRPDSSATARGRLFAPPSRRLAPGREPRFRRATTCCGPATCVWRTDVPRVLMVSPHFPPDSTGGTHRVRLLAPRLREHGWEPTVLTVDPRDYQGAHDYALADSLPKDLRVVRARAWPV